MKCVDVSLPQIICFCVAPLSIKAIQFNCRFLETTCPSREIVLDARGNLHNTINPHLASVLKQIRLQTRPFESESLGVGPFFFFLISAIN